jgi:succinate-semialdehyde dehydrogenase/glutarate-semialdehyde dehydrogenase
MTALSLKDSELFRQRAYIAGRWCEADNGKSFPVTNPATGEVLAQVPDMEATETRRAIDAAKAAWPEWRRKTAKDYRGGTVRRHEPVRTWARRVPLRH